MRAVTHITILGKLCIMESCWQSCTDFCSLDTIVAPYVFWHLFMMIPSGGLKMSVGFILGFFFFFCFFVLFCFVLFCFVFCFVLFCFVLVWFGLVWFLFVCLFGFFSLIKPGMPWWCFIILLLLASNLHFSSIKFLRVKLSTSWFEIPAECFTFFFFFLK